MTHDMVSSSDLIHPFQPSPVHELMSFPLEKCLCLVMSSVTGASALTGIPHPKPPGVMSISASLFQVPHPELTNVCYPILCASAHVLHQCGNGFYWSLHPCHVDRRARHFGAKYSVLITEVLLSSFSNTGDIYKILSNILCVPLWIYT